MILADMGAEVIKIERPGTGERSRINTPFIESGGGKVSARYLGVNRNKKSVSMDLRDPRCKSAFESIVRTGDVLLDNWGPGALSRLGLGYDRLREINPALVYASITGYGDPLAGREGPFSYWPANNPCVQGMGGWMEITGAAGGPPQMVGDNIGDSVPGVWTALGIMLALESRHKTGLGQQVDMSMYDCMVAHTTSSMPLSPGYGDPLAGREGPFSYWPANNPCVQGMGGWMEITGAAGGPPQMVGDNIGDSVPGVWTALGIMLALESRHKTGLGQQVDMSMYDCMVAHTTSSMPLYQSSGEVSGRARENMFSAQLVLKAQDGYVVLAGAGDEEKWVALWKLLGRDDLIDDPRYLGVGISGQFYFDHIVPAIEEWSQHLSKSDVTQKLTEIGYSMGMVQNVADLDRCPNLEARGMFVETGDTIGGRFRTVNTPIRLTGCAGTPQNTPPLVGEHNQDILSTIGGLSPEELDQMKADGVV